MMRLSLLPSHLAPRRLAAAFVAFVLLSLCGPALAQSQGGFELDVALNKSQILSVPGPYTDLMIANPAVADVVPLSTHSVYVVGKGLGSTSLTVYGAGRRLIAVVDVVVSPDIENLKARLHQILPGENDISAQASNQSLVLSGTVSSPAAMQQVVALADTFAPGKVVNMMGVEGTQQVMLEVRFVEMERTAAKNLNISATGVSNGNPLFNFFTGSGANTGGINAGATTSNKGFVVPTNAFGAASLLINGNIGLEFDALESKGLVKTLAEPTLVAMSGDTASFLAGGEFPIPVAQGGISGAISIEQQQFGISLAFTPTILRDGMINLVVNPEVSSIDTTHSVTLNGVSVPGLKVRRASTTVELRDGESFTIAGLLSDDYSSTINGLPFLGDVPVLGALFRSPSYQKDQTELVIVVTPHLAVARRATPATPLDHFVPPSDYELFLFGMLHGPADLRPEDRALISRDPTKGGVEGPYGHVVY